MATPRTHLPILGTISRLSERQARYETRALPSASANPLRGALCASPEVDPNVFFPDPSDRRSAEVAFGLCLRCPVRMACLREALASQERQGIRGGFSPAERVEILTSTALFVSGTTRYGKKGAAA
jgi:WhiB family redox-sensing transcriptional regulator